MFERGPLTALAARGRGIGMISLHVEHAERGRKYGILFIFNLFCEYINVEYVRVPVIYRVNQVEYGIHILVAASQEYGLTVRGLRSNP